MGKIKDNNELSFIVEKLTTRRNSIHWRHNITCQVICKYAPLELVRIILPSYHHHNKFENELMIACQYNKYELVKILIENSANIKSKTYDYLRVCIFNNHLEIIRLLIQKGIDINYNNHISIATKKGHFKILRILFSEITIDKQKHLNNALTIAASHGHQNIVNFLVAKGADVLHDDSQALSCACQNGHLEITKFLMAKGADIKGCFYSGFRFACENGLLPMVKLLLSRGVDIHAETDYALRWASQNGHLEIVKLLVENGANVQSINNSSVTNASYNNHLEVVKYLVEKGADVINNPNSITSACEKGNLEIVKYLIEKGANIHHIDNIKFAAENNRLEIVKYLIEKGVNINVDNDYVLKTASTSGYLEIVQLALENNANVHIDNSCMKNACEKGYLEITKLLIDYGANINFDNDYCLRVATFNGYFDIIILLIENGANVKADDNLSLRYACSRGYLEIAKYLIEKGADVKVIIRDKKILSDIKDRNHICMWEFLQKKLKPFNLWKKVRKSIVKDIPKATWQSTFTIKNSYVDSKRNFHIKYDTWYGFTSRDKEYKETGLDKLYKIIKEAKLSINRKNNTLYSPYLLKVQLAGQMTLLHSIPIITYNHIDCNNLHAPICYDISTVAEDELIKDKFHNWYHITDLVDERGNWQMNSNPYTKEPWTLSFSKQDLINLRKLYVNDNLREIHELVIDVDIHFNAVRTIMIELDKSTNSNHLDQIEQINPVKLVNFFKKEVVSLEYFRYYTNDEINTMKELNDMELFHKFLVITRTIMTDVNLSSYIGEFLENK